MKRMIDTWKKWRLVDHLKTHQHEWAILEPNLEKGIGEIEANFSIAPIDLETHQRLTRMMRDTFSTFIEERETRVGRVALIDSYLKNRLKPFWWFLVSPRWTELQRKNYGRRMGERAKSLLNSCIEEGWIQPDSSNSLLLYISNDGKKFATIEGLIKEYRNDIKGLEQIILVLLLGIGIGILLVFGLVSIDQLIERFLDKFLG